MPAPMPHDQLAERSVVGALLLGNARVVVAELDEAGFEPRHLFEPRHETICGAVYALDARGEPVDLVTVAAELGSELQRVGGPTYLHDLQASTPSAANAGHYAKIVTEQYRRRQVLATATRLQQLAMVDDDPSQAVGTALAELAALAETMPADPAGAAASRVGELREHLLSAKRLRDLPRPTPLVSGMGGKGATLVLDSLAWLYGKPGSGKSFVALDIACCVAAGSRWHGRDVQQGPVLYVAAEGAGGLDPRVQAWESWHRREVPEDLQFLPLAVQLGQAEDVAALRMLVAEMRPVLIVLDTQARVSVGIEENSARDMGLLVRAIDSVREASSACVLVVHHSGRAGENLRGSTAVDGAADTVIRCEKEGFAVRLDIQKQKNYAEDQPVSLVMTESLESVVLNSNLGARQIPVVARNQKEILHTFRRHGLEEGAAVSTLRSHSALAESSFHAALNVLVDRGLVAKEGRQYRLTPDGLDHPAMAELLQQLQ